MCGIDLSFALEMYVIKLVSEPVHLLQIFTMARAVPQDGAPIFVRLDSKTRSAQMHMASLQVETGQHAGRKMPHISRRFLLSHADSRYDLQRHIAK